MTLVNKCSVNVHILNTAIWILSSHDDTKKNISYNTATYGFVGDKTNMDEYGSIGFGPSGISSSSFLASSFFVS